MRHTQRVDCPKRRFSTPLARTKQRYRLTNMELRNEIHHLNSLHRLIKMCYTGSPDELAHKLHISKRHLYNVLDELRALGAKIDYSRSVYTFYYTNSFELHLNLQLR